MERAPLRAALDFAPVAAGLCLLLAACAGSMPVQIPVDQGTDSWVSYPDAQAGDRGAGLEGSVVDSGPAAQDQGTTSTQGCSDQTREGFTSVASHPSIAGCAGGWSVPGLTPAKSPSCGLKSGNSSANPSGSGCAAEDLCATSWHICATATEVAAKSSTGCTGATSASGLFFASRQSGPGYMQCGQGTNDLFGCGTLGDAPDSSCTPLDRFSHDLCSSLGSPWSCGSDGEAEAKNVTKSSDSGGGVLCCKN